MSSSGAGVAVRHPLFRAQPFPLVVLLVALLIASLAAAAPIRAAKPDPTATDVAEPGTERIEAVIGAARGYLGVPYRIGSEGPALFDCSGLVFRIFSDAGQVELVGGARLRAAGYQRWFSAQGRMSTAEEDAARGDLVMYDNGAHIGIYLGEGRVISALTSGVAVHSMRGINQAVTGFLKVDWTGEGAGPITDPGALPEVPEVPASLVPAVPWIPVADDDATTSTPAGVERTDMRTATSRTFEDGEGNFTTEFFARPIFYQPPESTDWIPIDLRFAPSDNGNLLTVSASPVQLGLSPTGSDAGFLAVSAGERALNLSLVDRQARNAAQPAVSVDGRYADYFDFLPNGAGLRVVARADGFQSFLAMAEEPRSSSFSFVLDTPGLAPTLEPDGSIALRDESGAVAGRLPRPFLLDSSDVDGSGGGVYTSAATLGLSVEGDQNIISINVGRRYLDEAVYPAYVNFSLVDFPAPAGGGAVTFASSRHPNANFDAYLRPEAPGYADLWHGRQPGTRAQSEIYLRFDGLAQTLGAVDVAGASLELFPYWQADEATAPAVLHRVLEPWQAAALTWNARPLVDAAAELGSVETTAGEWAAFDAAAYVAEIIAGASDNGLALGVETDRASWKRLVAGSGDPLGLGPRLRITWSGLRPTPLASSTDSLTAPMLSWSHAAVAAEQGRFEVQVSRDGFETQVAGSGVVKRRAGTASEWSVPVEALNEGATYQWRVRVKYGDERAWSPWSEVGSFTFGLPRIEAGLY